MHHYDNIVTTAAKLHAQAINILLEFHTSSGLQHILLDEPTNHPGVKNPQSLYYPVGLETVSWMG